MSLGSGDVGRGRSVGIAFIDSAAYVPNHEPVVSNVPRDTMYPTFEAAEKAMRELVGSGTTMKCSPSGNARSPESRNKLTGATKSTSFLWIDPAKVPHYCKTFSCVHHARRNAVLSEKRKRNTMSLDKGCNFGARIVCMPKIRALTEEPVFEFRLSFTPHRQGGNLVNPDGHNHNTADTADVQYTHLQNKKLTFEEKRVIATQGVAGTSARKILSLIGGAESQDGRLRTTKAISNEQARQKRAKHAGAPTNSSDLDYVVNSLLSRGATFQLRVATAEKEFIVISERYFENNTEALQKLRGTDFMELHMAFAGAREIAQEYGDVVGIDSTHNTNSARIPLYLTIVGDPEGSGQITTASLFRTENADSVRNALTFAKNVTKLDFKTILMDKDNCKFSAIRDVLPSSRIVLCRFHVIKAMKEQMLPRYVPHELRSDCLRFWRRMVHASDSASFESAYALLKETVGALVPLPQHLSPLAPRTLIEAIEKNWLPIAEKWVYMYQRKAVTRNSFTNNRNESKHNSLKKEDLSLHSTLEGLVDVIARQVLFDAEKTRDTLARRMHCFESQYINGRPQLPTRSTLSFWLGAAAQKQTLAAIAHADTHPYSVTGWQAQKVHEAISTGPTFLTVLTISVHGLTPTSVQQKVVLTTRDSTISDKLRTTRNLRSCLDPSAVESATCSISCDEFVNMGGTPCRHVAWVLLHVSCGVPDGRVPLPYSIFPRRDLARTGLVVFRAAANAMRRTRNQAPMRHTQRLLVTPLPRLPPVAASDQIVRQYMQEAQEGAHLLAAASNSHVDGTQKATHVLRFLEVVGEAVRVEARPLNVKRMVSLWKDVSRDAVAENTVRLVSVEGGGDSLYLHYFARTKRFARDVAEAANHVNKSPSKAALGQKAATWSFCVFGALCSTVSSNKTIREEEITAAVTAAHRAIATPTSAAVSSNDAHLPMRLSVAVVGATQPRHALRETRRREHVAREVTGSQTTILERDIEEVFASLNKGE